MLLCLTHEHGYGNWQKIKHALKRDTRCRFDHLFISRTTQELQKRVDILVKSLEKEVADLKAGRVPGASNNNKRRNNNADKKRDSAQAKEAGGADSDVDMALDDRAEIGLNNNEDDDEDMVNEDAIAA